MNSSIITPPTEEALEAFLPLDRARGLCFVNNSRQDDLIRDYRRAAYNDGQAEARASFLPQTIKATFRTPHAESKAFGLECKIVDPDGVQKVLRLPQGPIISITSIVFIDESGLEREAIDPSLYSLESNKFLRWSENLAWPYVTPRPTFAITYQAGFADDNPKLAEIRMAVGELLAVKWDSQGGTYSMPTSAKRVFHSLRGSRTYLPGVGQQ